MTVGPDEYQPTFIEGSDLRFVDRRGRERYATRPERILDRLNTDRRRSESKQDEAVTEQINDRAAVAKPRMRGTAARSRQGAIVGDAVFRRARAVRLDDRGRIIA